MPASLIPKKKEKRRDAKCARKNRRSERQKASRQIFLVARNQNLGETARKSDFAYLQDDTMDVLDIDPVVMTPEAEVRYGPNVFNDRSLVLKDVVLAWQQDKADLSMERGRIYNKLSWT